MKSPKHSQLRRAQRELSFAHMLALFWRQEQLGTSSFRPPKHPYHRGRCEHFLPIPTVFRLIYVAIVCAIERYWLRQSMSVLIRVFAMSNRHGRANVSARSDVCGHGSYHTVCMHAPIVPLHNAIPRPLLLILVPNCLNNTVNTAANALID